MPTERLPRPFGSYLLTAALGDDALGRQFRARRVSESPGFVRLRILDAPELSVVLAAVTRIARETPGRELAVQDVRAVRMVPGDYIFVRHDRVYDDRSADGNQQNVCADANVPVSRRRRTELDDHGPGYFVVHDVAR